MPDKTIAVKISGRVQGVGYRQWMVGEARARGLRGWVRNRAGGWVEALVHGRAELVDAMLEACREGPISAAVESVEVAAPESSVPGVPEGFVALGTR